VFTTKNGYNIFELASALQKDIRRGKEYEAMFWAAELEDHNPKMLWNRLKIIVCEDIGIAEPTLPLIIDTLARWYFEFKKHKNQPSRLFLAEAILLLCRSKKSRIVDDFLITVYGERKFREKKPKIPDYALDMHTLAGKRKGRCIKHFFEVGSKLENEAEIENVYKEKAKELLLEYGHP